MARDDDAMTVIDHESATELRAGLNLDPGEHSVEYRNGLGGKGVAAAVQTIGQPVQAHGMLGRASRLRIGGEFSDGPLGPVRPRRERNAASHARHGGDPALACGGSKTWMPQSALRPPGRTMRITGSATAAPYRSTATFGVVGCTTMDFGIPRTT